jgi:hypothetical protein
MDTMHGRFLPASTPDVAATALSGGSFLQQAWRRLATWRPVVAAETLIGLASLAFTAFYNHAFWHLLFS